MNIDCVFSGGGIKGFALIGAYQAIEEKGFTLKRVAGTSAGAIIAGLVVAGYKSEDLTSIMSEMNLMELLDPGLRFIPGPIGKWISIYFYLGLYKGRRLEEWIEGKLRVRGIQTFADLPPESLRVVASDLTNGRLLVLPDDLSKYGIDPQGFSVAKAIYMSAALPFFFQPVKLKTNTGKLIVVDGGVLSSFPMWLFHQDQMKKTRPVLGVKLSHSYEDLPKHEIDNGLDMFEALFETMKEAHDARYISRKLEKNIIFIPTEGILTTDFSLTEEKKNALIVYGRKMADEFLSNWTY
ncbi:patatin-like phospholipase family protein [Bacillus sp. 2205SS5-2]|uniref:patatin-like phospholipase family protein n=1 Tax=Bacillus sp. 2205SS5-2 TaxID=3109031 RepID=UPI00300444A2